MGTKRIVRVKGHPDYKSLFSMLEGLCRNGGGCYWLERKVTEGNISDLQDDSGQMSAGVEILLKMSQNVS